MPEYKLLAHLPYLSQVYLCIYASSQKLKKIGNAKK